ncbi:MAG: TonB-dependent receptor plug domain-containing protein [Opitutaceae bacterium]
MNPTQQKTASAVLALLGAWPLAAQTATPAATDAATPTTDEDVVVLSPFEVTAESSTGYTATQTLAGSRINTRLEDVGSAITVVTAEFLKDTGATDNKSLLAYTTNTEVGGSKGNFTGAGVGTSQDGNESFTSPNQNTRIRGLTAADNTRNFFMSDIPWDGYNVDRVDMQRGPNSILFGLGSPAGIINTSTKTAQHRKFGSLETKYGSYGTTRIALDYNQDLIEDELAVRINLLRNHEMYKQEPAYSLDRRIFATLRYDPKFLNSGAHKTTLKMNFESGSVRSNNPRTFTPQDRVTAWWTEMDQEVYNPNTVQYSGNYYDSSGTAYYPEDAGQFNSKRTGTQNGTTNPYFEPWLGAPAMYGGIWAQVETDEDTPYLYSMPEYKNIGGLSSTGAVDGGIGGLLFSRRVTVATTSDWATNSGASYSSWGVWKNATLSDASVFDFYNNLIDGDNKKEWQNFHNYNATLTQTFFNQMFGLEAAYDHQRYRKGQYSYDTSGSLYVDINSYNADGTENTNVGKAYIASNYVYGNNAYDITRESARLSVYFDYDFNKGRKGGWLRKLLGRHTISGLYSQDSYRQDSRTFMRYGTPDSFAALVSSTNATSAVQINGNDRVLSSLIYLSDSLQGVSLDDVNISRAGAEITYPDTVSYRYFDSTWNATGVDPAASWTSTATGAASTQAENPANYVGWTTTSVDILSAEDGDQDALTYSATLSKRKTDSRAAVWQGYFWDSALVGMYGIRKDHVKTWSYSAAYEYTSSGVSTNRVDFDAISDEDGHLQYSTAGRSYTIYDANSPSWSVVLKLNKFFGDRLPINVSLFYNESQNFQVSGARQDIYGNDLPLPTGETNERGILLSTKDGRFSFKINKYETKVFNAASTASLATWYLLGSGDNFFMRMENRADIYEYHLGVMGDASSAGSTTGWTWQTTPLSGQTQAQADAVRDAAVAAWRSYCQEPVVQKILGAWGFNDFSGVQMTTMSDPVSAFTVTEDQVSKGWEYELTANITKNWRVSANASKTLVMRNNVGGSALAEFVELTNEYMNGAMGDIRMWSGGTSTALTSWNSNFYRYYLQMKLQEGTYSSEFRKWRFNLITNYDFREGFLKGVNIGAGYRWQDKYAIGYPVIEDTSGSTTALTFDFANPYWGPSSDAIDAWIGYERKLTDKINWRIQLNVRNIGDGNKVIPVSTQYDGTVAAWAIAPCQTWSLTNTFSF